MIKMASPIEASQQLDPFYIELLEQTFTTSKAAIDFCRNLCAQFGFTVKQESSTHRNIYVYCSREGLADSVRNPKSNPKRKRPSKRCDCKWRVVLNESKDTHLWRFRKSNNPEALHHNHPLMRPEEVERGWPNQVHELIRELARQHLSTQEIRQQVQNRFPDITWNERRFIIDYLKKDKRYDNRTPLDVLISSQQHGPKYAWQLLVVKNLPIMHNPN